MKKGNEIKVKFTSNKGDKLNITLADSEEGTIPSPAKIFNSYPKNPYEKDFCSSAQSECAIRMSETFYKLSININSSNEYRKVHKHENGVIHQPSAKAFADWLWGKTKLKRPKIMKNNNRQYSLSDFSGKSGLIYFVHPRYGGDGPGHIDVIFNGNIGSGFYDNSLIWFWEYKNNKYLKNE